ncbi:DsrE family protein [uncultured Rubinisphaera sp.]|uniref:DsrE family protein n=1 Tax=uncultured Rubinisphaera sp. TaxID=1678686 RepID=UPI0030DC973F|tara:strand:- start:516 stop:1550 length:1035 start_codon:yes stop_codon:yes gene_type:complete
MNTSKIFQVTSLIFLFLSNPAWSQDDPGSQAKKKQPGYGHGRGMHQSDGRHEVDHKVFQYLLQNHDKIVRTVKELPDGVETLTESDVPEVAEKIKDHVEWMAYRVENRQPIRMRDPLFAELFKHTDKIKIVHKDTEKGVKVIETSDDPYVVRLIQAHAKAVSGFVERGFAEAMKNHSVPETAESGDPEYSYPAIAEYGKVVQLPNAAQQPRDGSKILVDVTKGGTPDKLNPAIEKVARFVNIYQGAGKKPAQVEIAIVLHGEATLTILNSDIYSKRFETKGNPNLDCLHQLHEAGVEIFVCGQSLIGKNAKQDEVVVFVDVAVSALTSLVNLQADGFSYVPLGN